MADSSAHELYIVEETGGYGITPTNPVWVPVRHNACSINVSSELRQSKETRSDRQITGVRGGSRSVAGDISAELFYGAFDFMLEAALCGNWAANAPVAGTDQLMAGTTRRSFSILRRFTDIPDKPFLLYTGVEFNSLGLSVSPEGDIGVTFGVIGKDRSAPSATAPTGSTYATVGTTEAMDSFTGGIDEGGVTLAIATELSVTLENGLQARKVIGSTTTIRPSIGKSNVKAALSAYFENATLLDKINAETETSIELTVSDPATNAYVFRLPAGKYPETTTDTTEEGPILLSLSPQFYLDSVTGTNMIIERTPV